MNWSRLNSPNPVIDGVISHWQRLVDGSLSESAYHEYIKAHANLFLADGIHSFFAISKLKLGSELELDFAVPVEGYSRGLFWELIEIEKPQDAPYTRGGIPCAALTKATQQVRDWDRWLKTSRNEARRLFSTRGVRTEQDPNFRFTIIIGTRENSEKWIEQRNQYSDRNGIEVRSFDYLTVRLRTRTYRDQVRLGSGCWDHENGRLLEQLANPFVEAFTDSEWKEILRNPRVTSPHFTAGACEAIVTRWRKRHDLIAQFEKFLSNP